MIQVFSHADSLTHWPSFGSIEAAMSYIENHSSEFENAEIIAIVDFQNLKTKFVRAELTMTFREIDS